MIIWISNIPWVTDHLINLDCSKMTCIHWPIEFATDCCPWTSLDCAERSSGDLWCKCLLSSLLALDQPFADPLLHSENQYEPVTVGVHCG